MHDLLLTLLLRNAQSSFKEANVITFLILIEVQQLNFFQNDWLQLSGLRCQLGSQ